MTDRIEQIKEYLLHFRNDTTFTHDNSLVGTAKQIDALYRKSELNIRAEEREKVLKELEEISLAVTLTMSKDGKTYGYDYTGIPHRLILGKDFDQLKQGVKKEEGRLI